MSTPYLASHSTLDLKGADAPRVWTVWHPDGTLSVVFDAQANQSIGLIGTPTEIRFALARGLAEVDRAVEERVEPQPTETP